MKPPLVVDMMSKDDLLWRCLHGGPLSSGKSDPGGLPDDAPWAEFRTRNILFLKNLTEIYGACGVVAKTGSWYIGHLRFYPKIVRELAAPGLGLCLQQEFPYGPAGDFGRGSFPPLEEIKDKTILVHCMMIAADVPGDKPRRRQGTGTRMARALIDWARAKGWHAIEATAYEALPVVYAATGQAGRRFWENLGFRLVRTDREPTLAEESEFVRKMREEALTQGFDPAKIVNRYVMRLDLPKAVVSCL